MPETAAASPSGIALCPSRPHRAVLGLVRVAMGAPAGDTLVADLKASDPEELVRIAVHHYVHVILSLAFEAAPALAEAVPGDLVIFFSEMRRANLRRNAALGAQLAEIGAVLAAAGLRGVVLKGGVELVAPLYDDPASRFLSDLDILVPAGDLDAALAAFRDAGAVPEPVAEINQRGHHHAPPLRHPDWLVPVELHLDLGAEVSRRILGGEAVLRDARPSGMPGLDLPSPVHRLAHAVLHAQIDPPRHRDQLLSPRDLVEMEVLRRGLSETRIDAARALFSAAGEREAWAALDAARALLLGPAEDFAARPGPARAWALGALDRFGRPARRRWTRAWALAGYYARQILFDPERRRHYLREAFSPGGLGRAIRYQLEKFRRDP